MLEAAPAETPGIVPDTPGTGFDIDPDVLEQGVKAEGGFRIPS